MLQTLPVIGKDLSDLTQGINTALSTIKSKNPQVQFLTEQSAVIIYELTNIYENCICCECQYWDESQNPGGMMGLCQHNGGRKRFSNKACDDYKDVRE